MRVTVYGLWHLGCVTAACLAEAGHQVVGLDIDERVIGDLCHGRAPLHEPGLDDLLATGLRSGSLRFTTDPSEALAGAEVLWVTFDTPVNDRDEADVDFVRDRVRQVARASRPGTLVLISSQAPVSFTRSLEESWPVPGCHFACSPENLRLGKALDVFRHPERVVIGTRGYEPRGRLTELFAPLTSRIEWMSVESAEMTKHALNAFLATSVTFINEIARLCEVVGADAKEVERGLKSEGRIGPKAYLSPGAAFAGGTLARDVTFLVEMGQRQEVGTPLFRGVLESNHLHKDWTRDMVTRLAGGGTETVVAVLGLAYKPGTSTLRRSSALELCGWLREQGMQVRAHDPAIRSLPEEMKQVAVLCQSTEEALAGADLAVVATEWPEYRQVPADRVVGLMRRPRVIDPNHFLAPTLSADSRITYVATGSKRCQGPFHASFTKIAG
jgi:UDPglucose 6-dehydrogenase